MEEATQTYKPLGQKTLFMLIFKKSYALIFLLALLIFFLVGLNYVPQDYINIAISAVFGYVTLILVVALAVFFIGWLQYMRYGIFVNEKDLRVSRGLIAVEEVGIPWRHINDVKIERSLIDQIFGVSDIVITMVDSQEDKSTQREPTIVLPSVEREVALKIQDSILKRAQVEQINLLGKYRGFTY